MTLVDQNARSSSSVSRIVQALRPWWPHKTPVEDPVDATLMAWLSPGRYVSAGLLLIAVVFGGLVIWNGTSELERGASAEATVEPESYRKTVDSRYGGVIREVLVREFEQVQAGQPLLVLDSTEVESERAAVEHQLLSELARAARLAAIRDDQGEVRWPAELLAASKTDVEAAAILEANTKAFRESRETLENQIKGFAAQIDQTRQSIAARRAVAVAFREQQRLIQQELHSTAFLLQQGLERKPKLLELQRTDSQLSGQAAATDADVARLEIQMRELEVRVESTRADVRERAVRELTDAHLKAREAEDKLRAKTDIVSRTIVRAPQSGTVMALQARTVGSAIKPGEALMQIVPHEDTLRLRVTVGPQYIADIEPGTKARVTIEGASRPLRGLHGVVAEVSPDLLPHPRNPNASAYIAEVEVHTDSLRPEVVKQLRPGMAAHVKLITGTRSVWTYMTESLFDAVESHGRLVDENGER